MSLERPKAAAPKQNQAPAAPESKEDLSKLTPEQWKERLKVAVVNIEELAESAARDRADRSLTESAESMRGISGFFKKMWRHGPAREYYRQIALAKAREDIHAKGDIYAAEDPKVAKAAHDTAMKAVVDRFARDYDETLHKGQGYRKLGESMGDQRPGAEAAGVNYELRKLIEEYSKGQMSDDSFLEQKKRVIDAVRRTEGADDKVMYADNLLEVARNAKLAVEHGVALDKLDLENNVVLGKAKDAISTEANHNSVDRIVDELKNSPVGRWVNHTTLASGVAIAFGVGTYALRRATTSRITAWATFGASAFAGGAFLGIAENKRMKEDRAQHARERAQGRTFEKGSPRREQMEGYLYDMKSASELTSGLKSAIAAEGMTKERAIKAFAYLADIEARIKLMEQKKIDLLSYSDPTKVNQERLELDLARAEAKVALRNLPPEHKPGLKSTNVETLLKERVDTKMRGLIGAEGGINERDALFKQMKRGSYLKKALWGSVIGLGLGMAGQEVAAYFNPHETGAAEHLLKGVDPHNTNPEHVTALERLRMLVQDNVPHQPEATHPVTIGASHFTLPVSYQMHASGPGVYSLMHEGKAVAEHLKFDKHGVLDAASAKMLADHGIKATQEIVHTETAETATRTAEQYLEHHKHLGTHVSRELWYDNDTPKPVFDKNELKLWWGGHHNTGIDAAGNYTFNVEHMMKDGSYHHGLSANAKELYKGHHLKLLLSLSENTQAHPVELPIDEHGNVQVKPGTEIAKLFFSQHHGKANFTGRFAEVAQETGVKDGTHHVKILATYEGPGRDEIMDTVKVIKDVPHTTLVPMNGPGDYYLDPPPIVPVFYRTPLEPVARRGTKKELPNPMLGNIGYYGYGSSGFGSPDGLWAEMRKMNAKPDPYTFKMENGKKVWYDKEGEKVHRDVAREQQRIREYMGTQDQAYLKELARFNNEVGPMDEQCRVAVIIPARFEEKNLANLLDQYSQQTDADGKSIDPRTFEIDIVVNRKEGEQPDRSIEVINEWKKAHPEYKVNAIDVTFPSDKANVGLARKYITDLALMRSSLRKNAAGPLYIESEDADLVSVDKRTVSKLTKDFDAQPEVDVLRGVQDRQPEVLEKNDLLLFERRLSDISEVLMRRQAYRPENMQGSSFVWNRVISGGWNTAFTAESYAQIGGYVPDLTTEDMKIGWKISLLRGSQVGNRYIPNTQTARASGLRASSSPRRYLDAMSKKTGAYDNFEDQSLKFKSLDELLDGVKEYAKAEPGMKSIYEDTINRLRGFIQDQLKEPESRKVFEQTLTFMGLKKGEDYTVRTDGFISLTDKGMPHIISLFDRYKKEGRAAWGYRRQNAPESVKTAAAQRT